jgi:hypothetical protein
MLFCKYQALQDTKLVHLGDAMGVDAHGIGTVVLGNTITFTGTLYMHKMEFNLFSVKKALGRTREVILLPAGCPIERNGRDILIATRRENIFCIDARPLMAKFGQKISSGCQIIPENTLAFPSPALQTFSGGQMLTLCHQRLGRLHLADVRRTSGISKGITLRGSYKSRPPGVRPVCMEGKQHRIFNLKFTTLGTEVSLALIQSESCNLFGTASIAGAKYFILLVDDYYQMTRDYF